jgi:hypothetical protein
VFDQTHAAHLTMRGFVRLRRCQAFASTHAAIAHGTLFVVGHTAVFIHPACA